MYFVGVYKRRRKDEEEVEELSRESMNGTTASVLKGSVLKHGSWVSSFGPN